MKLFEKLKNKAILKKQLKLCFPEHFKEICLNNYITKPRNSHIISGFSIMKGDRFFILPKGKAIFKCAYNLPLFHKNAELFCCYLAKQLNVNCADYYPARYKTNSEEYHGVVSYNFLAPNQRLLYLGDLKKICSQSFEDVNYFSSKSSLLEIMQILLSDKIQQKYDLDTLQIEKDIFKMIVFDYITSQCDRHTNNYGFIETLNKNKKPTLSFAPLYDNEISLGCAVRKGAYLSNYEDFIYDYTAPMLIHISKNNEETKLSDYEEWYYNELNEIENYANAKPHLKATLNNMLSKVDIDKVFQNLSKKKIFIDEEHKRWFTKCVESKMKVFEVYNIRENFKNKGRRNETNFKEM